jgi:hypothetical protein
VNKGGSVRTNLLLVFVKFLKLAGCHNAHVKHGTEFQQVLISTHDIPGASGNSAFEEFIVVWITRKLKPVGGLNQM